MVRKILTFGLLLIAFLGNAQVNSSAKSFRSYNADSLTVQTQTTGLVSMYDSVGVIYYNRQSSPAKWRVYQSGQWYDLLGGGGTITGATNGLSTFGTDIGMGGTLNTPTNIDAAVNPFSLFNASTMFFESANSSITFEALSSNVTFNANSLQLSGLTDASINIAGDTGGAGDVLTANGTGTFVWAAPSGGITNTAANNEMAKSDGTNLVPSGVFSTTNGNLNFGTTSLAGSRILTAYSVDAIKSFTLALNGSGNYFNINSSDNATIVLGANSLDIQGNGTTEISLTTAGGDFKIIPGTSRNIVLDANVSTGQIVATSLPTSDPVVTDAVWNSNGYLVQGTPNPYQPFMQSRTITGIDNIDNADNFYTIYLESASAFDLTIDQMTINSQVYLINTGAGTVTFVDGSGVTSSGLTNLTSNQSAVVIYRSSTAPIIR